MLHQTLPALAIFLSIFLEFYVQSFVNFTLTVLDELAITDHLQTIPKILKEIWQVLGESGEAFRKSILWIIETVRDSV